MDITYENNEIRQLAANLNFIPIALPKKNRLEYWENDKELYKRRNEIERLFRRLKAYRRIFTRYDKLDISLWASFCWPLSLRPSLDNVNTP